MSDIMFGKNRKKKYELGQKIKAGGEGTVYSIAGRSNLVAKVYKPERLSDPALKRSTEDKILAMLNMSFDPRINGELIVAWPTDALYDSSGSFIGYVMPKIENMKSLVWAMRPSDREALWPKGYRWRYSIAIAFNLSCVIEKLHASGIVVGDMNTNNILIDPAGNVTMIDAGSFNIRTKDGSLYKCIVGFPEVLPPELQGKDLTKANNQFSDRTDCFALAIHIFTLLNNNCHPFGCLNYNTEHASSSNPKIMDNIVKGFCPYVNGETENTVEDSLGMAVFSNEINALFKRSFQYDAFTAVKQSTIANRPTAKEWREALGRFYSTGFISCSSNPLHEYSKKYKGRCPWCAIDKKKGNPPDPGTGMGMGSSHANKISIPIIYCDRYGNTLRTSQINIEYGKTDYAYAEKIQGYHLIGSNSRIKISVDKKGKASQNEIRFVYEREMTKKKKKHTFLRVLCTAAILYCFIMYGLIRTAVDGKEYDKALEYIEIFPIYCNLFPDEYKSIQSEAEKAENQHKEQSRKANYNKAVQFYRSGNYSEAYSLFTGIIGSYQDTALYITFCKAHMYKAADYFSTIYDNMYFEDAKDLLTLNADMFSAYMKGTWHYYNHGSNTATMYSDGSVIGMPESPADGKYTVQNGIWKYMRKGESYYTDYYTIEIISRTMFELHPIRNSTEYTLFKF